MIRLKFLGFFVLGVVITLSGVYGYSQFGDQPVESNKFVISVNDVLNHPVAQPRTIRAPRNQSIILLNWGTHRDARNREVYPIADVVSGQRLIEFGTIYDGRIIVCYTYDGLPAETRCNNGAAFLMEADEFNQSVVIS